MEQPHRIQAVVFDLDDTLYPERDYVASGYAAVCGHLARSGRVDERACFDLLWSRFGSGQVAGAFDALGQAMNLNLSPDDIRDLVRVYREHTPRLEAFGGLPAMLGRLHEHLGLGLLSDGYQPAQNLKLEALRLGRFFDEVLFTEDLGRDFWKPSPRGFELISRRLGAPHERCCYVGDNPAKDFVAPNKLGWLAVQYLRPGQIHAANPAPPSGAPRVILRTPQALRKLLGVPEGS